MLNAFEACKATKKFQENLNEQYEETVIIAEHLIRVASSRGFFEIEFNLNKETEDTNKKLIKYLESKGYQVDRIWKRCINIAWRFAKELPTDSFIDCKKYMLQTYSSSPIALNP